MAEVAKLLGVELGEEFECDDGCSYVLTNNRLMSGTHDVSETLINLLTGCLTVRRKPWKPKEGEQYWLVLPSGEITYLYWHPWKFSIVLYKIGNCYRTYEEAKANRDKWSRFYASDEVLEV